MVESVLDLRMPLPVPLSYLLSAGMSNSEIDSICLTNTLFRLVFRLYLYPLKVLYSTGVVFAYRAHEKGCSLYGFFNVLLWILFGLNIYWLFVSVLIHTEKTYFLLSLYSYLVSSTIPLQTLHWFLVRFAWCPRIWRGRRQIMSSISSVFFFQSRSHFFDGSDEVHSLVWNFFSVWNRYKIQWILRFSRNKRSLMKKWVDGHGPKFYRRLTCPVTEVLKRYKINVITSDLNPSVMCTSKSKNIRIWRNFHVAVSMPSWKIMMIKPIYPIKGRFLPQNRRFSA